MPECRAGVNWINNPAGKPRWDLHVQSEYTYFALFLLIATFALMTLWRMFRSARSTFRQLNEESRRDKLQHQRIARERDFQTRALRRGTRGIDGTAHKVRWDKSGRRAQRSYHLDEAADEVFDPVSDVRGMDIRTPWGWPGSKKVNGLRPYKARPPVSARIKQAMVAFFKPKKAIDEEVRARRALSIRSLVEDRYGRVGFNAGGQMSDIEWSRPALPRELMKERETDQILARKPRQGVQSGTKTLRGLQVVGGNPRLGKDKTERKAFGA